MFVVLNCQISWYFCCSSEMHRVIFRNANMIMLLNSEFSNDFLLCLKWNSNLLSGSTIPAYVGLHLHNPCLIFTSLPLTHGALAKPVCFPFLEYAQLFPASRLLTFLLHGMHSFSFFTWLVYSVTSGQHNCNFLREAIHDCNIQTPLCYYSHKYKIKINKKFLYASFVASIQPCSYFNLIVCICGCCLTSQWECTLYEVRMHMCIIYCYISRTKTNS